MEILGWATHSRLLLVRTEEWQEGSDAPDTQRVLAIDVGTGMVYEPNLEDMLDERRDKQCMFRVTQAGFKAGENVDILVRAHFSTFWEEGQEQEDVPLTKRCQDSDETWSFNYATGAVKQVSDSERLEIYRHFAAK